MAAQDHSGFFHGPGGSCVLFMASAVDNRKGIFLRCDPEQQFHTLCAVSFAAEVLVLQKHKDLRFGRISPAVQSDPAPDCPGIVFVKNGEAEMMKSSGSVTAVSLLHTGYFSPGFFI